MGRHRGPLHPLEWPVPEWMEGYLEVPFKAGQSALEKAEWLAQNMALHVAQAADKRRVALIPYDAEDLTPPLTAPVLE